MSDRESWNMARLAQQRLLPKERKLHPHTAGDQPGTSIAARIVGADLRSCKECGYHVHTASCPTRLPPRRDYSPGYAIDRAEATLRAMNRAREALDRTAARQERARISDSSWLYSRTKDGTCGDCARAREHCVTHCLCGRPTGY
jgi:hypothetical protein